MRDAVDATVRYQIRKLMDGDAEGFARACGEFARDSARRSAAATMLRAAERDRARGVRFARVPSGTETCAFCRMLASRGFVYWPRETAGALDRFHRGCDCRVVASDDPEGVEGYDPDREWTLWKRFEEIDADNSLSKVERERRKRAAIGGVNVMVDELTPCLRRISDGMIVQTKVAQVHPRPGEYSGWEFDWSTIEPEGYEVKALYADGDDRVQGLVALRCDRSIRGVFVRLVESAPHNSSHNTSSQGPKEYAGVGGHLFAEAVRESIESGYNGFVAMDAKTSLIDYYRDKLGAKVLFGQRMFIDEGPARRLYEKYYG